MVVPKHLARRQRVLDNAAFKVVSLQRKQAVLRLAKKDGRHVVFVACVNLLVSGLFRKAFSTNVLGVLEHDPDDGVFVRANGQARVDPSVVLEPGRAGRSDTRPCQGFEQGLFVVSKDLAVAWFIWLTFFGIRFVWLNREKVLLASEEVISC